MFCKPVKKRRLIFMKKILIYILLIFFFCSYSYSQSNFATSVEKNTANPVENDSVNSLEESSQEPALQTGDTQNFVWLIYHPASSGTAFPIGPNLFVTNFHVLYSMLEEESSIKDIALHQKGAVSHLTIKRVVAMSALYDLVLFETEESVTNYLNISDIPVRPNEELLIPGYPQNNFKEMKKIGKIVIDDNSHYAFPVNYFDLRGASGSPVLNAKEQVIGVVSKVFGNILITVKLNHLRSLIAGEIGLNCSNLSLVICIEEETKNLRKLAEQGDALAQYKLANMYSNGEGVERNLKLAFSWMQKSAKQNFFLAQNNLAMMYYKGEGTERNLELAFYLWKEAAKQNFLLAQYHLANMYYYGEGVERNLKLAFFWMQQSAEQDFFPAQYKLANMYSNGEGVERNLKLAYFWMQQSAKQGDAVSQYVLSLMYYNGVGTERNLKLADYWMQESVM